MSRDDVDRLAALGRRAARAVGHRDERRVQAGELFQGRREVRGARPRSWAGRTRTRRPARRRSRSGRRCASAPVYEASRQCSAGSSPSAGVLASSSPRLEVGQPGPGQRQLPARHLRAEPLAPDGAGDLVGGQRAVGERRPRRVEVAGDQVAVALDVARDVDERAGVAGEGQAGVERLDDVQRPQELAHRIGRVADVEVLRDAAEQMVAGDQQPLLGLVQADVRGRVAGCLDHLPGAGVGLDRDAGDEVAVSVQGPGLTGARAAPALRPAPQRLFRHATLQRDLERAVEIRRVLGVQAPAGVHPDLAPRPLGDRRRLPAVVDVGVGDDDELDVADPVARGAERPLEVAHRVPVVHPRVDEHDPVARPQRPRVAMRHRGQVERQPQAPDAGQHALATADVACPGGLAVSHLRER